MGIFSPKGKAYSEKTVTAPSPSEILTSMLKTSSGTDISRTLRYSIFYQIIAFRGVKDGLGCSTIVANTALALANLGVTVCVVDTSILNPSQNELLHTNYKDIDPKKQEDWFSLGFTKKSVLNQSKLNSRISVLAFKDRNIVDLASTADNESLVQLAYTQLATKFDIILVDVCSEPSNIAMAAMQYAHKIIQVWSNAPHVMRNVDQFIKNATILSIPTDKMRYVVSSMTVDDIPMNWDAVMEKYKFKHLAHVGMSMEIARILATGKMVYEFASRHEDVAEFNECILAIVAHLVIPTKGVKKIGTYSVDDIEDGRTDGILQQKYADTVNDYPEVSWRTKKENDERQSYRDSLAEQTSYTKEPEIELEDYDSGDIDIFSGGEANC